jgi:Asp-tRNA(Asn)/Glu-tRNA(Gln) amidotransferase A subunit family amidase
VIDATALAAAIRAGELSPIDVLREHQERIERRAPDRGAARRSSLRGKTLFLLGAALEERATIQR